MDIVENLSSSFNKTTSKDTDANIKALGKAIKAAQRNGFPALRTPIIAGGVVRDFVHGIVPKDYDVFLDISRIPADEQEDAVLLFGLRVIDELTKADDSVYKLLSNNPLRAVGDNTPYVGDASNIDPRWKNFFVFETGELDPYWFEQYHETARERGWPAALKLFKTFQIQFIGHNDSRLSEESPISFVEYFDYDLVRCLYDPEVEQYVLHPDFLKAINGRKLETDNTRTRQRISSFFNRISNTYTEEGARIKNPYTLTFTGEQPKPISLGEMLYTGNTGRPNPVLMDTNWRVIGGPVIAADGWQRVAVDWNPPENPAAEIPMNVAPPAVVWNPDPLAEGNGWIGPVDPEPFDDF